MLNKQEIISILMDEVGAVYCTNCRFDMDDDHCEFCHRKYMNWQLSDEVAERIADKILDE